MVRLVNPRHRERYRAASYPFGGLCRTRGQFVSIFALERELASMEMIVEDPSREALFLAGHAHTAYRRRGGPRTRVLADFLIGAQAVDRGAVLVTRDAKRYRTAFPDLRLTTP